MADNVPVNPGSYIRPIIEASGLSQDQFAKRLGITRLTLSELINTYDDGRARRAVTAMTALRLERLTGITAPRWLKMQADVDIHFAQVELGKKLMKVKPLPAKPARHKRK